MTDKELIEGLAKISHDVTARFYSNGFENALDVHKEIAKAALSYMQQQVRPLVEALNMCRVDYATAIQATNEIGTLETLEGRSGVPERIAREQKLQVLTASLHRIEEALAALPPMMKD